MSPSSTKGKETNGKELKVCVYVCAHTHMYTHVYVCAHTYMHAHLERPGFDLNYLFSPHPALYIMWARNRQEGNKAFYGSSIESWRKKHSQIFCSFKALLIFTLMNNCISLYSPQNSSSFNGSLEFEIESTIVYWSSHTLQHSLTLVSLGNKIQFIFTSKK